MSITDLSNVSGLVYDAKKETLKYTCLDCDYETKPKVSERNSPTESNNDKKGELSSQK